MSDCYLSIHLSELLGRIHGHRRDRKSAFWKVVYQRAAQYALAEPTPMILRIPRYPRRLWSNTHSPDQILTCPPDDDELIPFLEEMRIVIHDDEETPPPEILERASRDFLHQRLALERAARGETADLFDLKVDGGVIEFDPWTWRSLSGLPIRMHLDLAYCELMHEEVGKRHRRAHDLWDYVVQELLKQFRAPDYGGEQLVQYVEQVYSSQVSQSDALTTEIARLHDQGFTEQLLHGLHGRYQDDAAEMGLPKPAPERAASSASEDVDRTATGNAKQPDDTSGKLKPCHRKAKALYEWAMEHIDGAENMTYSELFDALQNNPHCAGEGLPDNAEAFAHYCREAGIRRNRPRRSKGPTRSLRRASEL